METFNSLLFLQKGNSCTIHTLDGTGPIVGTVLDIHIDDFAEKTYAVIKIKKKFRMVKVFDDNVNYVERE